MYLLPCSQTIRYTLLRCASERIMAAPMSTSTSTVASLSGPAEQNVQGSDLFGHLKLSSHAALQNAQRDCCGSCGHYGHTFCMSCYCPIGGVEFPRVEQLPVHIDVIRCVDEGKRSTSPHARLVSPANVTIYDTPTLPSYDKDTRVVLLYPEKDATSLADVLKLAAVDSGVDSGVAASTTSGGRLPFDRALFIDGTWRQAARLARDKRLSDIPRVILHDFETTFWRPQRRHSSENLATIEAIYHFCVQLHSLTSKQEYDGRFDDLLWLYVHTYNKVLEFQAKQKLKHSAAE